MHEASFAVKPRRIVIGCTNCPCPWNGPQDPECSCLHHDDIWRETFILLSQLR